MKLVDAGWIWTEPHCRRLKVKLTIQKEVFNGVILQQSFPVEFIVQNQQCPDCERSYTEHTWQASVQVRQKVKSKKTFFYLEQMLLKHGVCDNVQSITQQPDGLDFFWDTKSGAMHLLSFLQSVLPIKTKSSERLISQDFSSNTVKKKFTFYAEVRLCLAVMSTRTFT